MDFRFTDDQQDLIDAAKAVFDGEYPLQRLRDMASEKPVSNLWPTFSELGLIGLMATEELGGLEQPLVVMAGVAEAAGYVAMSEPLIELAGISIPLLSQMGEPESVSNVVTGELPVGLITPALKYLNWAQYCAQFVVTTPKGGNLIDKDDVELTSVESVGPLRCLFKTNLEGEPNEYANHHGAVLTAAQLIGLSQRMVDMSVEYAKDRRQFGKPIGSFQAIKHQLANVYTQIEFTRPMVHLAAVQGGRAVHTAKVAAIDTAMLAAETAIQVHGGMGYTFEVDLHLFMKRAWALCSEWGDRNYHMKKLEDLILNSDADLGPGTTFN